MNECLRRRLYGFVGVVVLVSGFLWVSGGFAVSPLTLGHVQCISASYDGRVHTDLLLRLHRTLDVDVDVDNVYLSVWRDREDPVWEQRLNLSDYLQTQYTRKGVEETLDEAVYYAVDRRIELAPQDGSRRSYNVSLTFQNMGNLTLTGSCTAGGLP